MRHLSQVLQTSRGRILFFGLTVLLPSLFLGLLAVWAFQGEELRQRYQRKERQEQVVRLLESELNNWLFALPRESSAPKSLLSFEVEEDQLFLRDYNIVLSPRSRSGPALGLSPQDSRLWWHTQALEGQVSPAKARSAYLRLAKTREQLGPLARLALLRLALSGNPSQAATWLDAIRKYDRESITESGIPVCVASALLLIADGKLCVPSEVENPSFGFLTEVQIQLVNGLWKLAAPQWVFYVREISAALEACQLPSEIRASSGPEWVTLARSLQLANLIGSLVDVSPQILSLSQSAATPVAGPIRKRYFSQLDSFVVLVAGSEGDSGYLVERTTLEDEAERRLAVLTRAEDFRGVLVRRADQDVGEAKRWPLASFSPLIATFATREGTGGFLDLRQHFFFYAAAVLLLVTITGLLFTYRAVSREMEVARLKSDFVSAVSHEFRSPLAAIQAMLERIQSGRVSEEEMLQRYHGVIAQEVHRLTSLVNQLLDFARLEEGKEQFSPEVFDLGQLARGIVKSFHDLGHGERVHLLQREVDSARVWADRKAIIQCIHNLLDNALKYSPSTAPVTVHLGRANGEAYLEVSDQGPGIASSEQERIFEQFYRAPNTDGHHVKGVGIGLALVRRIMARHGGRVTVESQPGKGSQFRLVFPTTDQTQARESSDP